MCNQLQFTNYYILKINLRALLLKKYVPSLTEVFFLQTPYSLFLKLTHSLQFTHIISHFHTSYFASKLFLKCAGFYGAAVIVIFAMMLAVFMKKAWLLVPHICLQVVSIFLLSAVTLLTIYAILSSENPDKIPPAALVIYGLFSGLSCILEAHFVVVVAQCFWWFRKGSVPYPTRGDSYAPGVATISSYDPARSEYISQVSRRTLSFLILKLFSPLQKF